MPRSGLGWFLVAVASAFSALTLSSAAAQTPEGGQEPAKPVAVRIGEPSKEGSQEVSFPLVIESSGVASVGRIRAEFELAAGEWKFRRLELAKGIDLRSSARARNEDAASPDGQRIQKQVIEWDVTGEGKVLPAGPIAKLRFTAVRAKGKNVSDNPPALVLRKLAWGLAEMEHPPENLPQLESPDGYNGNPAVGCFFFTH